MGHGLGSSLALPLFVCIFEQLVQHLWACFLTLWARGLGQRNSRDPSVSKHVHFYLPLLPVLHSCSPVPHKLTILSNSHHAKLTQVSHQIREEKTGREQRRRAQRREREGRKSVNAGAWYSVRGGPRPGNQSGHASSHSWAKCHGSDGSESGLFLGWYAQPSQM